MLSVSHASLVYNNYLYCHYCLNCVQVTNTIIVSQSTVDMLASLLMILTAVAQVRATGLDSRSVHDQFICRIWLTRFPLWGLLVSSTYCIVALAVDRYIAIVHPIFYKVSLAV